LTRAHQVVIGVVVSGALIIAGIGFAGSYAAVRELAIKKGFGNFSHVFPIGIDAGICVLLALDLLLTWIRIPFPLLRQTAWLLTAATIELSRVSWSSVILFQADCGVASCRPHQLQRCRRRGSRRRR
jgi:hypothetical protein